MMKWQLRQEPLAIEGVLADNDAKAALLERLLLHTDDLLHRLIGGIFDSGVIIIGDATLLPWVRGLQYLGIDQSAPQLLLPTNVKPNLPLDLLQRKIQTDYGTGQYALDHNHQRIIPLQDALPLRRSLLEAYQ